MPSWRRCRSSPPAILACTRMCARTSRRGRSMRLRSELRGREGTGSEVARLGPSLIPDLGYKLANGSASGVRAELSRNAAVRRQQVGRRYMRRQIFTSLLVAAAALVGTELSAQQPTPPSLDA